MIKIIKQVYNKYAKISKRNEYVSINQVLNDLYYLEQEARLKSLPKHLR